MQYVIDICKSPEKHNSELPGNIYHWFLLQFNYVETLAYIRTLVLPKNSSQFITTQFIAHDFLNLTLNLFIVKG